MSDEKQIPDAAGLDEIIPAREASPFQKAASGEKIERPAKPDTPRKLPFSVGGLIACIIAAAALWIAFAQSSRMDQLENQLALIHAQMARTHEAMASLNNRQTDIEQHFKDLVQSKTPPEMTDETSAPVDTAAPAETATADQQEPAAAQTAPDASTTAAEKPPVDEASKTPAAEKPAPSPAATETKTAPAAATTAPKDTNKAEPPARSNNGPWKVNLVSGTSEAAIRRESERLQKLGVAVSYTSLQINGKTWYRIYIPGFASKQDAQKEAEALKKKLHMDDIWVGK